MGTVKAIWTGYLGRASDGMICVPGGECEVDEDVARANPHFTIISDPPADAVIQAPAAGVEAVATPPIQAPADLTQTGAP